MDPVMMADLSGAAMAPVIDGMLHARDSTDRVYSALDAVVGMHTMRNLGATQAPESVSLERARSIVEMPFHKTQCLAVD
jgi:hypothetical protein